MSDCHETKRRKTDYAADPQAGGAHALMIGTGNSSLAQLRLYQRLGFRIVSIVPDFFANYPEPIYENGILCRDMVRLRYAFDPH